MKNKLLLLFVAVFLTSNIVNSQEKKERLVERSIYGIQAGLFGAWAYNETAIGNEVTLKTEIGLNMGVFGGSYYPKTGYVMFPTLSIEPRYYYNLKRRQKLGKRTSNNTGNFFSLKTSFNPDLFVISNYDLSINNHLTVIPKWGLKRTFAKNFEYEFSAGIGYLYDVDINVSDAILDVGFRIGYRF